ncbi:hypothetical protein HK104_011476 [Borealophlyctis nickersoniae]|nr:hypothetical protein HK104_011476 [Borealophlyctis nickersoniae]
MSNKRQRTSLQGSSADTALPLRKFKLLLYPESARTAQPATPITLKVFEGTDRADIVADIRDLFGIPEETPLAFRDEEGDLCALPSFTSGRFPPEGIELWVGPLSGVGESMGGGSLKVEEMEVLMTGISGVAGQGGSIGGQKDSAKDHASLVPVAGPSVDRAVHVTEGKQEGLAKGEQAEVGAVNGTGKNSGAVRPGATIPNPTKSAVVDDNDTLVEDDLDVVGVDPVEDGSTPMAAIEKHVHEGLDMPEAVTKWKAHTPFVCKWKWLSVGLNSDPYRGFDITSDRRTISQLKSKGTVSAVFTSDRVNADLLDYTGANPHLRDYTGTYPSSPLPVEIFEEAVFTLTLADLGFSDTFKPTCIDLRLKFHLKIDLEGAMMRVGLIEEENWRVERAFDVTQDGVVLAVRLWDRKGKVTMVATEIPVDSVHLSVCERRVEGF